MRFSIASAALLSLQPLLVSAEGVADYQAQFQNYLDKFMSYIPNPSKHDAAHAAETKAGAMKMDVLTLSNWKETLYSYVKPDTTTPEEVWVLITGGNKTCYGYCGKIEAAFNETAAKFAVIPGAPHTALLNCDNEPVLCSAWSAPAGAVWMFEMLPPPAEISIWAKRLNMTTTTADDLVALQKKGFKTEGKQHEGFFHPFDGPLAKYGLNVPFGYFLWAFNMIPSWLFMIGVSMISRSMMSNRMPPPAGRPGTAAGAPAQ